MIKYNLNDYILVCITETGWAHLIKTVGCDYIKHCIDPHKTEHNGRVYHKLQGHHVFSLLPVEYGGIMYYEPTIYIVNE